jgi:hypothetical protein
MRHARQDDQREREGPFCSAMKAQDDNPLSRAVQSSKLPLASTAASRRSSSSSPSASRAAVDTPTLSSLT